MALRVTDTLKEELEQGGSEFLPFTEESLVYKWMVYHHDDRVEKEFKQQQQLSFSSGGHHRTDSTEEEQELFPEALESSSLLQNTVWQEAATISSPSTLSSFSTSSTYSHTSQCASSFSSQTSAAAASQNETTAGGSINSTISAFTPGKLLWPSLIRTHKQLLGIQEVSTILILSQLIYICYTFSHSSSSHISQEILSWKTTAEQAQLENQHLHRQVDGLQKQLKTQSMLLEQVKSQVPQQYIHLLEVSGRPAN